MTNIFRAILYDWDISDSLNVYLSDSKWETSVLSWPEGYN
jgi:hypothetical protein